MTNKTDTVSAPVEFIIFIDGKRQKPKYKEKELQIMLKETNQGLHSVRGNPSLLRRRVR